MVLKSRCFNLSSYVVFLCVLFSCDDISLSDGLLRFFQHLDLCHFAHQKPDPFIFLLNLHTNQHVIWKGNNPCCMHASSVYFPCLHAFFNFSLFGRPNRLYHIFVGRTSCFPSLHLCNFLLFCIQRVVFFRRLCYVVCIRKTVHSSHKGGTA